jgi:hypothetical protein
MTFFRAYPMTPLSCLIQSGRTVLLTGGGVRLLAGVPDPPAPCAHPPGGACHHLRQGGGYVNPSLLTRLVSFCFRVPVSLSGIRAVPYLT